MTWEQFFALTTLIFLCLWLWELSRMAYLRDQERVRRYQCKIQRESDQDIYRDQVDSLRESRRYQRRSQ